MVLLRLQCKTSSSNVYGRPHNNRKSHASTVKNADSWFVEIWDATREVSFSTKSYIIAVDSYDLDEEDLVVLSDELQIWEE